MAAAAAEEAAAGQEDALGADDGADVGDGDPLNESGVNLEEYLNTQFTPGIDDHDDMLVNPVIMYIMEREKREEKLREKEAREAEENRAAAAEAMVEAASAAGAESRENGNGRAVRNFVEQAMRAQALRLADSDKTTMRPTELARLEAEDFI